jgi:hypothetical protein
MADELSSYMVFHDLQQKVMCGDIPVDFGGHFQGKLDKSAFDRIHVRMALGDDLDEAPTPKQQVAALRAILDNPELPALEKPIDFRGTPFLECSECAEDVLLSTDGKKLYCRNPCTCPDGIGAFVFELNIPSGRMAVANDLRNLFPIVGDYNINSRKGMLQTSMKYAEAGMAHGFVGNTCPGVYRTKKDATKFIIGCSSYDEDGSDESRKEPGGRSAVRVGGVCTDLWWYSVVDGDELERRLAKYGDNPRRGGPDVDYIECKPGVYRFTHVYHMIDRDDFSKPQVYCTIERVRKPDPMKDYEAEYKSLDLKAGQVILQQIRDWPSLYNKGGERTVDSIQRAADQLMIVGGSGDEIHPNGWRGSNPDLTNDHEDMEIPLFDKAFHWYPLSDSTFLVNAAGQGRNLWGGPLPENYLNESFTALGFNIAYSIVVHGCEEGNQRHDAPTNYKYACLIMLGLADRYPDRVPEYAKEVIEDLRRNHIRGYVAQTPVTKK